MKKRLLLPAGLLLGGLLLFQTCSQPDKDHKQEEALAPVNQGMQPDTHCVNAPASWFAGKMTSAPDDYGPFVDTNTTSDCDFHRWSWQKFLSLVRCDGCFRSPFEGLVQVDNDLNLRGDTLVLTDSSQAGTSGTLYDKNNHAIYYSIYVNQPMYSFQQTALNQFKTAIGGMTSTALQNQALHKLGYDTLTYPVGCFELKVSWILASSLSDPENYYTTKAVLTTPQGTIRTRVAMLGMHVLGRVANHPELIWATFEHDGLAPDYDWSTGKNTTTKVVNTSNSLFYNANTPVSGCPMTNSRLNPKNPQFSSVFNIYTRGMAQSFTANNLPSHRDSTNDANIVALNASVRGQLQTTSGPWKNYFYKGSMWLDDPTPASFGPGNFSLGVLSNDFLRGSRAISNITMETFAQINNSGDYTSNSMNCFGCHGTCDFKNFASASTGDSLNYNLALSHLYINALHQKLNKNAPKTE